MQNPQLSSHDDGLKFSILNNNGQIYKHKGKQRDVGEVLEKRRGERENASHVHEDRK